MYMKFSDIPIPEIYKQSADFRFFLTWFEQCLAQLKYDTENILDLYDPQRCPSELLWMLGDTMGYKYDDRMPTAFNRLVMIYFMSMIRSKGSKNGLTLAAEVNLAQFNILEYGKEKDILYDRLEDTSIPVNSVYVTPHPAEGYIDVTYFSAKRPVDTCIEYVRPLGMYCFEHEGVRVDARTKISIDARLTNMNDLAMSAGAAHTGQYSRADYASLQRMSAISNEADSSHRREGAVWYRNSDHEHPRNPYINPGLRALYSLQLSNNDHIVKALIPEKETEPDPIFTLGYGPQDVSLSDPDSYLSPKYVSGPEYNLLYDKVQEESISRDVYTVDSDRTSSATKPRPAVNPIMTCLGDAISVNDINTSYSQNDSEGNIARTDNA